METFTSEYAQGRWDRTKVLGVQLVPLTIDHALLLWHLKSPFLTGEMEAVTVDGVTMRLATLGKMVTTLYVLTRPCDEAATAMHRLRTAWRLRFWGWQLARRFGLAGRIAAQTAIERYLEDSFSEPVRWETQRTVHTSICHAPFLQVLKVRLQLCLGESRAGALSYPVREALWDLACFEEDSGRSEWVGAAESADIRRLTTN